MCQTLSSTILFSHEITTITINVSRFFFVFFFWDDCHLLIWLNIVIKSFTAMLASGSAVLANLLKAYQTYIISMPEYSASPNLHMALLERIGHSTRLLEKMRVLWCSTLWTTLKGHETKPMVYGPYPRRYRFMYNNNYYRKAFFFPQLL